MGRSRSSRVRTLLNSLVAIFTVLAVLVLRAVLKLPLLPFRLLRGLWRRHASV